MRFTRTASAAVGLSLAAALALTGCTSGSGSTATPSSSAKAASTGPAVDLKGVCPATVVIQTDWNPEADHGHVYQLVGPNPTIDANNKTVTGDLMANGKTTGVKVQINAGGPAIGYSTVSAEMYTKKSITLGYVSTDEAVEFSNKFPTTAVFAETNVSPQMIMWDPKTYPNVTDIKSLGVALEKSGGVVRYFNGAAYMSYLQGAGYLSKSVLDGSYDGTPAKFVAAKGKDAQQGFATAEPYIYQNEVAAWGKPVKFQLVADTGYSFYPEAMSVRTGDLASLTPCLKKLVPVLQQADVDYINNPTATNDLITNLVTQYNNGWVYDNNVANYAVEEMKKLKLVGNGPDGYVGEMETDRVQKIITDASPIFSSTGNAPKAGLKPSDIFTNQFLSKSVKF